MRPLNTNLRLLLLAALCGGCGGGTTTAATPPPPPATAVSSVVITPGDTSVLVAGRVKFEVTLRNATGAILTAPAVTWTTDNGVVATVSSGGTVTGVTAGTTVVRATSEGKSATATVHVELTPIAHLEIVPGTAGMRPGSTLQLQSFPTDSRGLALLDRTTTWTAENPTIATVSAAGVVTAQAEGRAMVTARVGDSVARVGITVSNAATNIRIASLEIVQNTQNSSGSIPLVAGRPTLVRAWVTGSPVNQAPVRVSLRILRGGVLVQTLDQLSPGVLPTQFGDRPLAESVNFLLPPSLDLTGVSLQAVVDPDDVLIESDEFDNFFPTAGPIRLGTPVAVPAFPVVFVPLLTGVGPDPTVTASQASGFAQTLQQFLPITTAVPAIHGPFTYPIDPAGSSPSSLLAQVEAIRVGEGSTAHYYGLISVEAQGPLGVGGIGYWPGRSALGVNIPTSYIVAHEMGHNLSLGHAPCGTSTAFDPGFPYLNGTIGVPGYDASHNTWYSAQTYEMMSYCGAAHWISDYNFLRAFNFHIAQSNPGLVSPSAAGPGIMVWGEVSQSGEISLNPVYAIARAMPERQDSAIGRADGFTADGASLFSMPLAPHTVADAAAGRHFAIAIPLSVGDQQRLARLRVTIDGHQVTVEGPTGGAALRESPAVLVQAAGAQNVLTWAAGSYPGAMIRDRVSGEILGFGTGGRMVLPRVGHPLEVVMSDGLQSRTVVIPP